MLRIIGGSNLTLRDGKLNFKPVMSYILLQKNSETIAAFSTGGPGGVSVTHQNLLILCATPPRHRRACGFRSPPAVTPQTKNSHCKSENFLSGGAQASPGEQIIELLAILHKWAMASI